MLIEQAASRDELSWVHDVDRWWAQAITVGWERITGRRLPHQMADGTFTANRSATITTDAIALREMLLDGDGRLDLFAGLDTELRSRPTSKNVRVGLGGGVAEIAITARGARRATIAIAHAKLSRRRMPPPGRPTGPTGSRRSTTRTDRGCERSSRLPRGIVRRVACFRRAKLMLDEGRIAAAHRGARDDDRTPTTWLTRPPERYRSSHPRRTRRSR